MKSQFVLAVLLASVPIVDAQPIDHQLSVNDAKLRADSLDQAFHNRMQRILSNINTEENGEKIFQPMMIDSTTMKVLPIGPSIHYHLYDPNDIFHIGGGKPGDFVPVTRRDELYEKKYREASGE